MAIVYAIACTSDPFETLSEIDLEYAKLAQACGIASFKCPPALNGAPAVQRTLADIVVEHLQKFNKILEDFLKSL